MQCHIRNYLCNAGIVLPSVLPKIMAENTSVVVVLWKGKTLKNGEFPIWIRIIKDRVTRYKTLGISCHIKDWDLKANLPKKSHPFKSHYDTIIAKAIKEHKEKILDYKIEGKDFTPEVLLTETNKEVLKTTVFKYIDQKVKDLQVSRRIGNSKVYKDTGSILRNFTDNKDFTFYQLDFNFLSKLEIYFRAKGLSDNGMSVRFRTIRAVFNAAIEENLASKDSYPFEKFKISERFSTQTKKRAISKEDVLKVGMLEILNDPSALEAQKYFMFSYYGQGINFVDMANLKWSNLSNGRIYYKRQKTGGELSFALPQPALDIIEHFKNRDENIPTAYIFPVLNDHLHITPTQVHNRIHKVLTRVNQDLKVIGKRLGIETPLTSYVARHSFATVLKRSGVSTAVISESMGHQTEAVTQTYLKSFENSIIDEAMKHLL